MKMIKIKILEKRISRKKKTKPKESKSRFITGESTPTLLRKYDFRTSFPVDLFASSSDKFPFGKVAKERSFLRARTRINCTILSNDWKKLAGRLDA